MDDIIDRIYYLLQKESKNPTELNNFLELTRGTVADWKRRKSNPSIQSLVKIAEFFRISLDWLLTGNDNNNILPQNEYEVLLLNYFRKLTSIEQGMLIGNIQEKLRDNKSVFSKSKLLTSQNLEQNSINEIA